MRHTQADAEVASLTVAIIAELRRQAESSGCSTEDNGRLVQVDGSFDAEQLAAAIMSGNDSNPDTRPSAGRKVKLRFWGEGKPEPPIIIAPIKEPGQMTEEEQVRVRLAALVETQTAFAMRDRLFTELTTSLRWIQASLLLVNGGAAVAVLQSAGVAPVARAWAGACFVIGIVLSILGAYVGVRLTQDAPVRTSQIAGYWLSVNLDLVRVEETEREWVQYGRDLQRRSKRNQVFGWGSLAAFVVGCAIAGLNVS